MAIASPAPTRHSGGRHGKLTLLMAAVTLLACVHAPVFRDIARSTVARVNFSSEPMTTKQEAPLAMSLATAAHLRESVSLVNDTFLQEVRQRYSPVNESHMEAFVQAKRNVGRMPSQRHPLPFIYQQCLRNFTRLAGYDQYGHMTALEQRRVAEAFWQRQQGKLWMQHSRKAGGTTLCMLLRLNHHGLIRAQPKDWNMPQRETCQIVSFCLDCDLTKPRLNPPGMPVPFRGWETIPRLVDCVVSANHRNFYEAEGTVSPPTILTDPEWANFVFVSTLRHPISRIISSLQNDLPYKNENKGCYKPTAPEELNNCSKAVLSSTANIEYKCHSGIYFCYSNYYIRMFSGHPSNNNNNNDPIPVTRETLEAAKRNFVRYSCVVLQEQWAETSSCLSKKLGLHLTSSEGYNVQGAMKQKMREGALANMSGSSLVGEFSESLTNAEYGRLLELNELDLEFYNWAREQIISGLFLA